MYNFGTFMNKYLRYYKELYIILGPSKCIRLILWLQE